jgi:2-isopropylmalate synthase
LGGAHGEPLAAEGDGPVHALDGALRRGLKHFYPEREQVRLSDYKVRVIDGKDTAKVRVLIESTDGVNTWSTLGVFEDIIGDIEGRFQWTCSITRSVIEQL